MVRIQERKPAPIAGSNHPTRPFRKVGPWSGGLIKKVTGRIGGLKGLTIDLGPLVYGQVLQRSHSTSPLPLLDSTHQLEPLALLEQELVVDTDGAPG